MDSVRQACSSKVVSVHGGGLVAVALTTALAIGACGKEPDKGGARVDAQAAASAIGAATDAAQVLAALRALPGSPVAAGIAQQFKTAGTELRAQFAAAALAEEKRPANLSFPAEATGRLHLQDATTGMVVDVSLAGARPVAAQTSDGYVVFPAALGAGTHLLHRALLNGAEDFVGLSARPAKAEIDYQVVLDPTVGGLRLVGGALEFVDASGTPRLHVAPPYILDVNGATTDAALAVAGCAVDTDPSAPWGRPVTAPGAAACTIKVTWPDASVAYPAILDPRWTTTGSMTTARFEHTMLLLSTGKTLAAGGRSTTSGTTGLASAELYDPASATWAATGSMAGGRRLHSMTQLPASSNSTTNGKVLVAGGISGTTSLTTAELYSPSAGTWIAAGALNAARHAHTATLLPNGRVLVAGGMNGTTALATAATYDPASGAGSWAATTGPIPPPGWRFGTATLIQTTNNQLNNKVLLVGGNNGTASLSSVFIYDQVQNAFSTLASIPSSPREQHTAVVLPNSNGKILIAGGKNGSTVLNTAILFDPSSSNGTWSLAGTMTSARVGHSMTVLPSSLVANGTVLVAGGSSTGSNTLSSAELFSGTATWTATPSMPAGSQGHQAVVLSGNMILVAGGLSSTTTVQNAAYLYDASFGLACSSNSQCASGFCANGVCCDSACNGGCGVCNLAGHVGTCTAKSSGTVCRAQSGACDVAEVCSGTSLVCPNDAVAPLGSVCRSAAGVCDVPETCDGSTKACPTDGFAPNTTLCRASTGTCDAAETCTGTSATCPADAFAPSTTVCRPATGGCDVAETCTGASATCPANTLAGAGTVCRSAVSLCDVAETCSGTSAACPGDTFAAAGTICGAASSTSPAPVCSGSSGTCPVGGGTSDVLGFEVAANWAFDPAATASVIGLSSNRSQGASSLEVAAQGSARLNSAPVSSVGSSGVMALVDILLPTDQANPSSYGTAQMIINSPSLGISNLSLGTVNLTGLALGTWETLAFQVPPATASTLATGVYSDLTFSIVLNVAATQTGHYRLDNIRLASDVVPSLLGVAQVGSTLKAVFDYVTTSSTPMSIPYGTANGLSNSGGFIALPPEVPPVTFVPVTHAPFVATLSGSLLKWTVGGHSATATASSQRLPVTTLGDGTHDATLPDGRKVNIDSLPPPNPVNAPGPPVGAPFNGILTGQFGVGPSGAATFTLPISVPPGIAGMAPNLALSYNSQGGDGIAGTGWNLSGLSMITRCPRTRQQDGYGRPVMLDSLTPSQNPDGQSDGICLDGRKLYEDPSTPGSYTAEAQDFSVITRTGTQFQVVTKAGETRYYGRLNAANVSNAIWLLDRVVDAWGNFFDIHYNNDQGNGSPSLPNSFTASGIWVSRIDYTGTLTDSNCTAAVPPASCTFASVTFQYECRGDIRWSRVGSLKFPQSQRLKSITTPQGIYSLNYSTPVTPLQGMPACAVGLGPVTGVSELTSIGYCAGSQCMQPLTFGWQQGGTGGSWPAMSNYNFPSFVGQSRGLSGTQFVDLNGDGRVDFVVGRTNGINGPNQPQVATVLNTGNGWSQPLTGPNQTFPLYLADANDQPTGVRFADMDGDGRVDVLVDSANVTCDANGCVSCPVGVACGGTHYAPAVWLNRFALDGTGGWQFDPSYSGVTVSFTGTNPTLLADVDGDGKADFIQAFVTPFQLQAVVLVAMNTTDQNGAHSWRTLSNVYSDNVFGQMHLPSHSPHFQVADVNRDGLPDLVHDDFFRYSDGSVESQEVVLMNQGVDGTATNNFRFAKPVLHAAPGGGSLIDVEQFPPHMGDLDGDGFHDVVEFASAPAGSNPSYFAAVGLGDGTGFGFGVDPGQQKYLNVIKAYAPPECGDFFAGCAAPEDYGFALVDINGDGLVDLVRNHANRINGGIQGNEGGGEILLNTGQKWVAITPTTGWQIGAGGLPVPGVVPSETTADAGSAFVDLDGDGMVDFTQLGPDKFALPSGAWKSPYARRVIKNFPNGLTSSTTVTYVSTTSAAGASTYLDDDTTDANTKPFTAPLMVVASVDGEDASGTGARSTRTYTYHSLRQDSFGRGPLGFHRIEMLDQGAQVKTVNTYAQAFPLTGMPTQIDKYQIVGSQSHLTNRTTTTYCNRPLGCGSISPGPVPTGTILFTYPSQTIDVAYLHPETDDLVNKVTTTTTFQLDAQGNATDTVTKMEKTEGNQTQTFQKEVQNFYPNAQALAEGKPNRTVATGTGGTMPTTHTTTFEYQPTTAFGGVSSRLVLVKKRAEPDAGWPIEEDAAYAYDQFGNLVTTTKCASDFQLCAAGATNANGPPNPATDPTDPRDPVHHPPFRTSTVSYDPATLGVSVSYGRGRFPAKATNAMGQSEITVFDPLLGKVVAKTGPNGIQTCYAYDPLGRSTSQTERCNSPTPLVTTTQYFLTLPRSPVCFDGHCGASGYSPPNSRVVMVTTPPTGAITWGYSDDQGKGTGSLAYSFDGGFVETTMSYNKFGQTTQASKPIHLATVDEQVTRSYTTTVYDDFHRLFTVTDPLGVIDGSGVAKSTTITTTYNGSTVQTDRVVNGQTQTRIETKNVIGKVTSVTTQTETGPSTISYDYDADGNVTLTTDPAGNHVQLGYDTRGRKTTMIDPDMGSWGYTVDGFGDLASQTDGKQQTTVMIYDRLGRMLTKADATGLARWIYDTAPGAGVGRLAAMVSAPDGKLSGSCAIPAGAAVTGGQRAVKQFQYTAFGDLQEVDECADGANFATTYQYDVLGRESLIRYPVVGTSQLAVGYHYTSLGFLHYLTDDSSDYSVLWQAKAMNVLGQVTDEQMRNGVETVSTRNPTTGWLLGSTATAHADQNTLIQSWSYGFDEIGNLLARNRNDAINPVTSSETFTYDLTNRLRTSLVTTSGGYNHPETYAYDLLGNLTQKAANTYTYGTGCQGGASAGPHAVCAVTGLGQFAYDANGNLTNSGSRSVRYNTSNKVTNVVSDPPMSQGNDKGTVDFVYGADGNRVLQSVTSGGVNSRTVYVGLGSTGKSLYERTTSGTTAQHVNFIYAGGAHNGAAFAMRVLDNTGAVTSNRYSSFDHLGSITALSDDRGHVTVTGNDATALSYDAWGLRRNPDGTAAANPAAFNLPVGHRQFTGQEQIPDVGLVNMNGRLYDPSLGRFLSPDPHVQFAADLQSYNRYSYTGNNPLRYTDPTGFFWSEIGDWLSDPHNLFNVGMAIVGVVVCAASEGAGCVAFGLMLAAMNATIAIANGASWQQTLLITGIGLTVGLISGGVANAAGGGALAGIIAGSVSAAVTTGISNVIAGRSFFEWNVLTAAAISAAEAGITMGLQRAIGVSQASADVGEGGSGSKRIERADGAAATDPDIDEKIENAKLEAAISGQTSTRQVGSLEVTVYGGTEAERQTALDALSTDLTQTDRGQQILDRLVNGPGADGPEIRPLEVVVYHGSGTFSYPDYRQIVFDPGDIGKPYWADPGVGYMSPDRLFAHELGHVVGYHDDGVGGLNNILTNENPIMKQLADPFNRTRLEPVR